MHLVAVRMMAHLWVEPSLASASKGSDFFSLFYKNQAIEILTQNGRCYGRALRTATATRYRLQLVIHLDHRHHFWSPVLESW